MSDKLNLNDESLLFVLQLALNSAVENKEAAKRHHDMIARGFRLDDDKIDDAVILAIKDVSESIEKYLKVSDASIDKLIKIAKLLSDAIQKRYDEEYDEFDDDDRGSIEEDVKAFLAQAKTEKEDNA